MISVPRFLGDRPITPPNMLPHVANYGHLQIHAWMCDVYLRTTGRQCMCVGWFFDSNQNVTVIADCEFISTRSSNTITLSSSTVSRTQKHKYNFWRNWIVGITTKTQNKSKINVIQQNQNPAHKTLLEETKQL